MSEWTYLGLDALARWWPGAKGPAETVVVFSPGHLGDILHVVPMLQALRVGNPTAKIHWLVGPWSEALALRYASAVDSIRIFGPNLSRFVRGRRQWRQGMWRQWRLAADLRREGVDVLIATLDGVGRFLANALRPRLWIGIGDRRPPRLRPEIQTHVQAFEKDRYEADAWCGLLRPLGIEVHAERLVYEVLPAERQAARVFRAAEGVGQTQPLALLAPGSGWSGKNWLPERFAEVAEWLRRTRGFQVAWIGGAGEESFVPPAGQADFRWVGKTPLPLLVAVMESATLFVGNDGGLLHFAAAAGVPTVSLWGPTRPGKWAPRGARHRHLRKVDHCDGCIYWEHREVCRHDRACMRAIATDEVCTAIADLLAAE